MLPDFPVLYVDAIVRRTVASCIALAIVAIAVTLFIGQYLAGAGIVLGLGGATLNHRLFQVSTAHYSSAGGGLRRKPYAGSVAARLGGLTAVAFGLLFFLRPMGFGMVGGLVAFQFLLMANALGALWRYQRQQLSGTVPAASPAAASASAAPANIGGLEGPDGA
ncbi:MAG: hypothetical protein ACRDZX_08920 [Acidimicrobiales bacterium]